MQKAQNILDEVNQRIDSFLNDKQSEIASINKKIEESEIESRSQAQAIKDATAATNLQAYKEAQAAKAQADAAIEMYSARLGQLRKNDYVKEPESDRVIDSILDYRTKRKEEFEKELLKMIIPLMQLNKSYWDDLDAINETINRWTSKIHANYRTFSNTKVADGQETVEGKSATPINVNQFNRDVSAAYIATKRYLTGLENITTHAIEE